MYYLSGLLSRAILCGSGVCLLGWGAHRTMTQVTAVVASRAFVNGNIVKIASPIGGQVQLQPQMESGMAIRPSQMLLKVSAGAQSSDWLRNTKVELAADRAKLARVRLELQSVKLDQDKALELMALSPLAVRDGMAGDGMAGDGMAGDGGADGGAGDEGTPLRARTRAGSGDLGGAEGLGEARSRTNVRIAQEAVAQLQSELAVASSQVRVAQAKAEKLQGLLAEGAVALAAVEEAQGHWEVSRQQVAVAKSRLQAAKLQVLQQQQQAQWELEQRSQQQVQQHQQLESQQAALVAQAAAQLRLQRQAQQQPLLALAEAKRQKLAALTQTEAELQARVQEKEAQLAQFLKLQNFRAIASHSGVLWEILVQDGDQIIPGQPLVKLVNCQQLWVDAFVNLDEVQRIQIGSPATVRLQGQSEVLSGRVKSIRSHLPGVNQLGQDAAVDPPDIQQQQVAQVRIELPDRVGVSQAGGRSGSFCNVGQMAQVQIGQDLLAKYFPAPSTAVAASQDRPVRPMVR